MRSRTGAAPTHAKIGDLMRVSTGALPLLCFLGARLHAAEPAPAPTPIPALFKVITVAPAHPERLEALYTENHDGDGEGEELPASVMYVKAGSKEYGTFLTITDSSLCKRPLEKQICQAFSRMVSDGPPAVGADVTGTRIGGSGYTTAFMAKVSSLKLAGVDSSIAFLGADSQDPPRSAVVLYVYAKRGSNLIQLVAPVGKCTGAAPKGTSDAAYYRACVDAKRLAKAEEVGKQVFELFALARAATR